MTATVNLDCDIMPPGCDGADAPCGLCGSVAPDEPWARWTLMVNGVAQDWNRQCRTCVDLMSTAMSYVVS